MPTHRRDRRASPDRSLSLPPPRRPTPSTPLAAVTAAPPFDRCPRRRPPLNSPRRPASAALIDHPHFPGRALSAQRVAAKPQRRSDPERSEGERRRCRLEPLVGPFLLKRDYSPMGGALSVLCRPGSLARNSTPTQSYHPQCSTLQTPTTLQRRQASRRK